MKFILVYDSIKYVDISHPLSESQVIYVCYEMLKALEYIHAQGIIHRDIKCANIMLLRNGRVKLGNFRKHS